MSSFSLSRLGKLVTKQFFENSRLYAYSVLALFGLLSLVFAFWITVAGPNYSEEATYLIFLFGLFITGSVFASMSFDMLGSKDKGIYWLSIPATHLEKLICTIFYSTIVFTAVYCLCFFTVKGVAVFYINSLMKGHPSITYTKLPGFDRGPGEMIPYFIYGYFAVQALYLLGSVYFSRFTFILTTVVGAVLIFAFVYYLERIEDGILGEVGWNLVSARKYDPAIKGGYISYSVSPALASVVKYIIQFAWAPVFWVATWVRLKEKQI